MVLFNIPEDSNQLFYFYFYFLLLLYIYSHINFILDIRLRYIDLVDSVIKHTITVGLGKIKTNNKGKELKSIVINDKSI